MSKSPLTYQKERGQSLVEMALVLLVLVFLIGGIIDLGRALFTYIAMRDAAGAGASYGSLHPDSTDKIISVVKSGSQSLVDLSSVQVNVAYTGGSHCLGNGIKVTVAYNNFPMVTPIWGWGLLPKTIDLTTSITDEILIQCPSP